MAPEESAVRVSGGELRMRIVSAAVLVPVALAAEIIGGISFALLVVLVAAIAFWEWSGMTGAGVPAWARIGALVCLCAGLLALALRGSDWAIGLIAVPALVSLAAGFRDRGLLWMGLGLLYVAIPCAGFIILRRAEPYGWAAILFVLFVVWATDTAAFFGGRGIGGPKLWPRVSPKKTWSGALSGLAGALAVGGVAAWLTGAGGFVTGLLLAAPLSVAAQAGDFLESAVKRRFGVKDSGHIIPGHGGVLDRMDGLFAAAALAWLIAALGIGGNVLALPADIVALTGDAA